MLPLGRESDRYGQRLRPGSALAKGGRKGVAVLPTRFEDLARDVLCDLGVNADHDVLMVDDRDVQLAWLAAARPCAPPFGCRPVATVGSARTLPPGMNGYGSA
jgi:hypothetical protein